MAGACYRAIRDAASALRRAASDRRARSSPRCRRLASCLLAMMLPVPAILAAADPDVVTVRAEPFTQTSETYAQVEPAAVVSLQASEAGIVTALDVVPGARVTRGEKLGELGGPEVAAALARARAAVAGAKAKLAASQQSQAVVTRQLTSHLSTEQQVLAAKSAVAEATGAVATAEADVAAAEQAAALTATADGTVLTVTVASGQRLSAGDVLATLAPGDALVAKATYFGRDAAEIRVGTNGTFTVDGNGTPIPVAVASAVATSDGGETVWLRPAAQSPAWRNGAFGTVVLQGPTRSLVAVPTRALILDQGRWWVLLRTATGEEPREVQPGPAHGWQTYIERGLEPGAQVVVANAYLEFHRHLADKYQAPD